MQISCITVEDEPLARERLRDFISRVPFLQLKAEFSNAMDAFAFYKATPVDLIFLDINLGEFSGIQLLETSAITSQVVITTAYHEYAAQGFDLNVTDYLLKPYTFERFLQAVNKVVNNTSKPLVGGDRNYIFIKNEYKLEKVFLSDIIFIEGDGDYRIVHTTEKKILTQQTFGDFEKEIPANKICRVHRSYMVALDKIDSIAKDRIKIGTILIPISETYKKAFYELVNHPPK
jgi:two-component system LytT family response regulator